MGAGGYLNRLNNVILGGGMTAGRRLKVGATITLGVVPGPRYGYGGGFRGFTMVGEGGNDAFFARWGSQITDFDRLRDRFINV